MKQNKSDVSTPSEHWTVKVLGSYIQARLGKIQRLFSDPKTVFKAYDLMINPCKLKWIFWMLDDNMTIHVCFPLLSRNLVQVCQMTKHDLCILLKVSKGEKVRYQYNQVPHLTQDTNGKVTNLQLDTTNESQEVSLFPAGTTRKCNYSKTCVKLPLIKRQNKDLNDKM